MPESKNFTMTSNCDGLKLSGMYVEQRGELKGIIQLVHGMAEHKERYLDFMQSLACDGYACVMMDHRGHGKSVKSDEDLGYFYDEMGESIVEDAHQLTMELHKQNLQVPIILFGHSMGSLVVRAYTKKYDGDIDALIVCGSPSKNPMAKLAITFVRMMKRIKGDHYRSRFIHNMAFSTYPKRFHEDYSENCWLSAHQRNVEEYDKDPYCGFVFTLNGFENLFHLMVRVYDESGWTMKHKDLPILFVAGENDPCIDNKEKFAQAYGLMEKCGYRNIEHHLFPGMRHEILNEEEHQQVYDYIKDWLNKEKLERK